MTGSGGRSGPTGCDEHQDHRAPGSTLSDGRHARRRRISSTTRERRLLAQFRHQYFLLFLIAHFHKAALLMLSDRLVRR